MGLPHSGQIGIGPSAAMCLALHLRRAAPFWYRPEPALLLMIAYSLRGLVAWARFEFAIQWQCLLDVTLSQRDRLVLYRTQAVAG